MEITAIKTGIIGPGDKLLTILKKYLPSLKNKDIVVVTSKIVSLSEGNIVPKNSNTNKLQLAKNEADMYIDAKYYNTWIEYYLTIKNNVLLPNAGVDESNVKDAFVLWPKNPMKSAENIWQFLKTEYHLDDLGVIITDSHTTPLRWGTTGIAISWCGFNPLKNYIGTPDIFNHNLKVTQANILDGLAAAAVTIMGEGNEQTPLAIIRNTNFVNFQKKTPTKKDIENYHISIDQDIYGPVLRSVPWKKGGS